MAFTARVDEEVPGGMGTVTTGTAPSEALLWPHFTGPGELAEVELL